MTTTPRWHLAQMNVATALYPLDDSRIADFVAALDGINALADASRGFVWRLQSDGGNATDIRAGDDPRLIVNMSVWETAEALFDFVYKTSHRSVMVRRREWFGRPAGAYQALWWVAAGSRPTVEDGLERLRHLDRHGPTPRVFTFKQRYLPPDDQPEAEAQDLRPEPWCVGWR